MAINLFGPTFSLLSKVLDLRSQRHILTASNIANADTPNYKSKHLKFEDELSKLSTSGGKLKLKKTDQKHMPSNFNIQNINPAVVQDEIQTIRGDGNTVDLDKEFVKMSKNQIMYSAVSQILAKKFRGLLNAIKEVR